MMIDQFESGIALWNAQRRIGELEQESAANLQRALVAEKELALLPRPLIPMSTDLLLSRIPPAMTSMTFHDAVNVNGQDIPAGTVIDTSTQEVG